MKTPKQSQLAKLEAQIKREEERQLQRAKLDAAKKRLADLKKGKPNAGK